MHEGVKVYLQMRVYLGVHEKDRTKPLSIGLTGVVRG